MSELTTCQSKDVLVACLYDEATPDERNAFEAHLAECEECRTEVAGLAHVRQSLPAWDAPQLPSPFRVVAESAPNTIPSLGNWSCSRP